MKLSQLRQLIKEEISKVLNESYKVISKKTERNEFSEEIVDKYELEINDENYTTNPDGLTFQLKTIGYVHVPEGETLNIGKESHYFYYIKTIIYDENGKELEKIPGEKVGGSYNINPSINKAKRWLNKNGPQLMSGKGFQHKST
jgi:hypothetical protein